MRSMQTDYLVEGAGAMGMAFTDTLVDHADVHVTLVDRRDTAGGHWRDAYPFVQLHQASVFYGVASTVLGRGSVQQSGPEAGLQERARQPEIQTYYDDILHRRLLGSGRVSFLGASEYHADGSSHLVTSRVSGDTLELDVRNRVVDATYLSPTIPATTAPPFGVADGARVVAVNELARLSAVPDTFVIVGSGKTATDGIVWLLANGVQADRIVWVRPRDLWMLNRAVVQPDPVVALGLAADTMDGRTEVGHNREDALIAEASSAIGADVELLAAGIFTLQDMIQVGVAGATIGGFAGGELAGPPLAGAVGSGVGMYLAKKEYAESHGMTVELIVAISSDTNYVLNRDTCSRLPGIVETFDRAASQITVKNLGPSRFFHPVDPRTGHEIRLGGTLMSKPDRLVMQLLSS